MKSNGEINFVKPVTGSNGIIRVSYFLMVIGIVNLLAIIFKEIGLLLMGILDDGIVIGFAIRYIDIVSFAIIILFYLMYYLKLKKNHDTNISAFKKCGIVIVGARVFLRLLFVLLSFAGNDVSEFAREFEKIAYFYLVVLFLLFVAIRMHDKKIIIISFMTASVYYILMQWKYSVSVGYIHGNVVKVFAHDLLFAAMFSIGMILGGIYIRRKTFQNENK